MSETFWTTSSGKRIQYNKLTDEHFKNILKDGYRNLSILEEARRRRIPVPERMVDKLSKNELRMYLDSFSSCAIAGDSFGEQMIQLWDSGKERDKVVFFSNLDIFLTETDKEELK